MDKQTEKQAARQVTADAVKEARLKCGYSRSQFAAACGISHQYLTQVENGVYPASAKLINNMNKVLSEHKIPDVLRSPDEAQLLSTYRQLTAENKQAIMNAMAALRDAQPTAI